MTTTILSAKELAAKVAEEQKQKALAAEKAHAAEEKTKKALLEKLRQPVGLSDDELLEKAAILINRAVESGQTSVQVFRFPHTLCTDNGRAVNQAEPGWEKTLVGEPKQLYELWQRQLKPKGYHLRFEIIDYPNGMPGDVGITLSWRTEFTGHQ
ncbi:MAG TPA: hypothetical protein VEP47_13770 [Reyranella sp.]|nr:hypothetical protein [Reyranella sp.]